MQNIILQELEELDGILIATTNLTGNLDSAFERRFLYKIEFDRPDAQTRAGIWSSLISGLNDDDARVLASRFDFTGGQIENIARKREIDLIIEGASPSLETLISYCEDERMGKASAFSIGFAA